MDATTQTPIFDAVAEAQSYTPGSVKLLTHKEFMAHHDQLRRQARKRAASAEKAGTKAPVKAPAKKAAAKKSQPPKG